jgi:hypothetical protein
LKIWKNEIFFLIRSTSAPPTISNFIVIEAWLYCRINSTVSQISRIVCCLISIWWCSKDLWSFIQLCLQRFWNQCHDNLFFGRFKNIISTEVVKSDCTANGKNCSVWTICVAAFLNWLYQFNFIIISRYEFPLIHQLSHLSKLNHHKRHFDCQYHTRLTKTSFPFLPIAKHLLVFLHKTQNGFWMP